APFISRWIANPANAPSASSSTARSGHAASSDLVSDISSSPLLQPRSAASLRKAQLASAPAMGLCSGDAVLEDLNARTPFSVGGRGPHHPVRDRRACLSAVRAAADEVRDGAF